jgi:hypothetical protein
MSPQTFDFPVLRSLGLSVSVAFLLGNASAMALPQTEVYRISQADDSTPSVVVDTEPTGTSTTPTSTDGSSIPLPDSQTRFSCQAQNGQYTVMYQPESQPGQFFAWATPSALGGGWSEQRRCIEIARRLESYRPDGLQELTTGVENNYNTVCVRTQRVPDCRIVFTVPPGQDPLITRDRVFENLTVADSGQQTDAIYTYRGRQTNEIDQLLNMGREVLGGGRNSRVKSKSINLRPFLDRGDGGTGTQLRGGVSKPSNSRLNPGSFR